MEKLYAQEAPQHLFCESFSFLVQKKAEGLGILSSLQVMRKEDFSVFLDTSQGLAERIILIISKTSKDKLVIYYIQYI